jgi:nicotinamide-nucleotide amidase
MASSCFPAEVLEAALNLGRRVAQDGAMIATAESCTGGLIASVLTEIGGSSQWFERGFVTYSNEAKASQLGVPSALIDANGAVSEPVARAMALGALQHSKAQLALAVTGIAGPGGGSPDKPVGTVWLAWAWQTKDAETPQVQSAKEVFPGDRQDIRILTVKRALTTGLVCWASSR